MVDDLVLILPGASSVDPAVSAAGDGSETCRGGSSAEVEVCAGAVDSGATDSASVGA